MLSNENELKVLEQQLGFSHELMHNCNHFATYSKATSKRSEKKVTK